MQSGEFLCKWLGSILKRLQTQYLDQAEENTSIVPTKQWGEVPITCRNSQQLNCRSDQDIWSNHNCQPESREKCWQLGVRRFILTLNTSSRHTRRNTWRICSLGPRQDVEINTSQCWHLQALYTLSLAHSQCRRKCSSSLNEIGSTPSNWCK